MSIGSMPCSELHIATASPGTGHVEARHQKWLQVELLILQNLLVLAATVMKDQLKRTTPCTKRCQLPVNHPSTKHEHWASRRHGVLDYCKDLWRLMKCSGRISSSGSNWYLWFAMICTSSLTSCNAQTCGNQYKHKLACPAINRHGLIL